jgi:cytochrome c oxidase subunit III
MATTLLPPPLNEEPSSSDLRPSDTHRGGGGPIGPEDEHHLGGEPEPGPGGSPTPLGAYRVVTFWTIVSIVMLFSTITAVLESRWANSRDWVPVPLPRVLYVNTAILLISSATIEIARRAQRRGSNGRAVAWLAGTLLLGLMFVAGQLVAWSDLVARGLYLASNPGSLFIYVITGAHGLHLLGGVTLLAIVALFLPRWTPAGKATGVDVAAVYWHFMDALWVYLLVLLFITVQR